MIAIVNECTVLPDEEIKRYVDVYKIQLDRDFTPVYGIEQELVFVAKGDTIPPKTPVLAFLDNSDQAGALGYHDMTNDGMPLGKAFAGSDLQYGQIPSVTGSHELLEMIADPNVNLCAAHEDANGNLDCLFAYEVADACQDDSYAYDINGIKVSDFVYPNWFASGTYGPFDHGGYITVPFRILHGGYIGQWTPSGGWNQIMAAQSYPRYQQFPPVGSRRERRARGKSKWLPSTVRSGS